MRIRNAKSELCLIIFCAVFVLINFFTLYDGHNWGGDFSQYILHAKNILEGSPYASNIMLGKNVIYPPGFPLLISPVIKFLGLNFIALKTINILFWYGFIFLFYLIASIRIDRKIVVLFCAFFAVSSEFFYFKQNVLSDIPFLFFSYLSIYLFLKYCELGNKNKNKLLIISAVFMGFSFLIRTAGLMLFVSAIYYILVIKRKWKIALLLCSIFMLFYFIQNIFIGSNPGFLSIIIENPKQYLYLVLKHNSIPIKSILWFFIPGQSIFTERMFSFENKVTGYLSPVLYLLISYVFIKKSVQRQISFEGCFFFFYLVMLLFWSGFLNKTTEFVRYTYPLLGLLLIFIAGYMEHLKKYGRILLKTFIIFIILLNMLNVFAIFHFNDDIVHEESNIEMFLWIKNNIKKDEHYMIWRPRPVALMTGRIGTVPWLIPPNDPEKTLINRINKFNISYMILSKNIDKFLISLCDYNSGIFNLVWQNKRYKIFKIANIKL